MADDTKNEGLFNSPPENRDKKYKKEKIKGIF